MNKLTWNAYMQEISSTNTPPTPTPTTTTPTPTPTPTIDQVDHLATGIFHVVNAAAHPGWYKNCDIEALGSISLYHYWQFKLPSYFDSVEVTVCDYDENYAVMVSSPARRNLNITKFFAKGDEDFVSLAEEIIALDISLANDLAERAARSFSQSIRWNMGSRPPRQ